METELFWGFSLHAWITIVTVLGMFTTLLCTKLRTDLVFLCAIGILYVTGVLDAKDAFSGFSSTSVVIIGVLFIVVAGLTYSQKPVRTTQFLRKGGSETDAPRGCTQFVPE